MHRGKPKSVNIERVTRLRSLLSPKKNIKTPKKVRPPIDTLGFDSQYSSVASPKKKESNPKTICSNIITSSQKLPLDMKEEVVKIQMEDLFKSSSEVFSKGCFDFFTKGFCVKGSTCEDSHRITVERTSVFERSDIVRKISVDVCDFVEIENLKNRKKMKVFRKLSCEDNQSGEFFDDLIKLQRENEKNKKRMRFFST